MLESIYMLRHFRRNKLKLVARFEVGMNQTNAAIPSSYSIGQEIKWDAPWIEVYLWVELPFWLMTGDTAVSVEVGGYDFEIAIHENYFELHVGVLSDSKENVVYRGPWKENDDFGDEIRNAIKTRPNVPFVWRKCKTVLKIKSRCNEDVWNTMQEPDSEKKRSIQYGVAMNGIRLYLVSLCRAHLPVVNRLLQGYRLATYDYFPYEVSPWDVPFWMIERSAKSIRSTLVPYRDWDSKPMGFATPF
jgi:hypothetical protein